MYSIAHRQRRQSHEDTGPERVPGARSSGAFPNVWHTRALRRRAGLRYTIGEITVERDGGIVSGNDALLES